MIPFNPCSSLKFLRSHSLRRDIRRSYSVRKTVIFGHSAGGAAAQLLFTDDCDALKRPIVPPPENFLDRPDVAGRFICEQVRGMPKKVKILGLVSYEGYVATHQ